MAHEKLFIEEIRQATPPQFESARITGGDILIDTLIEFLRESFSQHPRYTYVPLVEEGKTISYEIDYDLSKIMITDIYNGGPFFLPIITSRLDSSKPDYLQFSHSPFNTTMKYQMNEDGSFKRDTKDRLIPSHWLYYGKLDSSVSFQISAGSTIERAEIMNYLTLLFAEFGYDTLYRRGVFIKPGGISISGCTEAEYRNNFLYQQTISLDIYSEWEYKIPINLPTLKSIAFWPQAYAGFNGGFDNEARTTTESDLVPDNMPPSNFPVDSLSDPPPIPNPSPATPPTRNFANPYPLGEENWTGPQIGAPGSYFLDNYDRYGLLNENESLVKTYPIFTLTSDGNPAEIRNDYLEDEAFYVPSAFIYDANNSKWIVADFWKYFLGNSGIDWEDTLTYFNKVDPYYIYLHKVGDCINRAQELKYLVSIGQGRKLADQSIVLDGNFIFPDGVVVLYPKNEAYYYKATVYLDNSVDMEKYRENNPYIIHSENSIFDNGGNILSSELFKMYNEDLQEINPRDETYLEIIESNGYIDCTPVELGVILLFGNYPSKLTVDDYLTWVDKVIQQLISTPISLKTQQLIDIRNKTLELGSKYLTAKPLGL